MHQFGVDLHNVVRLLSTKLYSTPDVVVRELIQNAYDAIRSRFGAAAPDGRIDLVAVARTLVVSDNGTGMNQAEIHEHISTLGRGIKQLGTLADAKKPAPIGEYGIGFFSAFFIADRVRLRTRKVGDAGGCVWESSGVEGYTLGPDPDPLSEPGTEITLHVNAASHDFATPAHVQALITRYCQFLDCPIHVNRNPKPANELRFGWELTKEAERLKWVRAHLNPSAEFYKLGTGTAGGVAFQFAFGCGFSSRDAGHVLYSKRMFVTRPLLFVPEYLDFLDVLVACDDFQLNLARDNVHAEKTYERVKDKVEELLRDWLAELARKHLQHPRFQKVIVGRQAVFKELAADDPRFFDKIYPYLLFPVHDGDPVSVEDYAARPGAIERTALYTLAPSKGPRAAPADDTPVRVRLAADRGIPVFKLDSDDDGRDETLLRKACTKLSTRLVRLGDYSNLIGTDGGEVGGAVAQLQKNLTTFTGRVVRVAAFPSESLPLAATDGEIVLNAKNSLLRKIGELSADQQSLRPLCVSLLGVFEAISRATPEAGLDAVSHQAAQALMKWADMVETASADRKRLRALTDRWWVSPAPLAGLPPRTPFVVGHRRYTRRCFVVRPFAALYEDVQSAVVTACAAFDVLAEDAGAPENEHILAKVCKYIDECDFAIADVSENNPNVLFELGLVMARRKPVIVICRDNPTQPVKIPTDIIGIERVDYVNVTRDLPEKLKRVLATLGAADAVQPEPGAK